MKINKLIKQRKTDLMNPLQNISQPERKDQFTFSNRNFQASADGMPRYNVVMPDITEKSIANAISLVRRAGGEHTSV